MENIFLTVSLAFFVISIALILLAIGWLITGKSKISPGACGRDPTKKSDESCGKEASCGLCKKDKKP